jgi:molybdopterin molybdotransferase
MLTVEAAQQIILRQARLLAAVGRPLGPDVLGLVLAEEVASDLDQPPFDKAMMDGYAVRSADFAPGGDGATLEVIEEITAGKTPRRAVGPGQASRIMTGAPIPQGADAVVMVELTSLVELSRVRVQGKPPGPGHNILERGREMRQGEVILGRGTLLRPQEIGVLAGIGRSSIRVIPTPEIAILSTGDEVVEADQTPAEGQIRNSNGPMLQAQVRRAGAVPRYLGIARDELDSLVPLVRQGLQAPLLILSGGVSAGKRDLVPGVLQEAGVVAHFHKVEMKPGKPIFFGSLDRSGMQTLVFGLPGNPVSALACFELFVRPALRVLQGRSESLPPPLQARLAESFSYRTDRPTYHPARLEASAGTLTVRPVPWFGSADLRGLTRANALVLLPAGDHMHPSGQLFSVIALEGD